MIMNTTEIKLTTTSSIFNASEIGWGKNFYPSLLTLSLSEGKV